MEIIKGALAQDYRGPIYKLLEQAAAQKAEQMQSQQPQQRETGGLVQSYESTPPSMINLPTGQKIGKADTLENAGRYSTGGVRQYKTGGGEKEEIGDTIIYPPGDSDYKYTPYNKEILDIRHKLNNSNVSNEDLQKAWQWEKDEKRWLNNSYKNRDQEVKTGGIRKYETGGDLSEEEMDLAYEDYTMRRSMEDMDTDHDSSISYNDFSRLSNTYGTEQAMGYFSNEKGQTVQPFANWKAGSSKKAVSQNQVQSWSQEQKTQYYNELYGGNKLISPTEMMEMDQAAWDKANPPEPSALDAINSEVTHTEAEEQNLLNLNLQRGQQGGDIVRKATAEAAPYVLGGLGLVAAAPFAIGGLVAGSGGGVIGLGSRQALQPVLRYGTKGLQGFKNAFGTPGGAVYRTRQFMSGLYNTAKTTAVPQMYSTIGNQAITEMKGEGDHKNRLKTATRLTDLIPSLSTAKDAVKITSDLASGDYTSAGMRGLTLAPGFKKSQFGTGVKYHGTKLLNRFLDTKPDASDDVGLIGDIGKLNEILPFSKSAILGNSPIADLETSDEEEKVVMRKGGFKKRKKLQYGGYNPEARGNDGIPIGAGTPGSRNDPQQAISRVPEISEVLGGLDYGDAAKAYLNETFNPTKWFDGKSASKAAYNELVPLNARLLIEDVVEEQLFNKDSVYGKYSPLAYLPESAKKFLGYKDDVTEKDLSKGELEALRSVVENRKHKNKIDYEDYPGGGVQGTTMREKMTDNNTVLETTLGQAKVKETDHDYMINDQFDFNYNKWQERNYREGRSADNMYNYIRWQFAPKYGSTDGEGMPVNINIPKIGDGNKVTKTGAKEFDEGPKFKQGGVRKYHEGGTADQDHIDMMNNGTIATHNAEGTATNAGNSGGDGTGVGEWNPETGQYNQPEADFSIKWGSQDGFGVDWGGMKGGLKKAANWGKSVWDKSSGWGKAGIVASGVGLPVAGLAAGLDPTSWFKEGGVRKGSRKVLYNKVNKKKFKRVKRKK